RSGRLEIITRDDKTTIVPFRSVVTKTATNWSIAYTARPGGDACESLVIEHITGRPNRYARSNCATGNGADSNAVKSVELLGADLVRPFGRSDFWICDLGLEFLDWPRQRVLSHEIRNSRSCWVLESSTSAPVPGGYARVISWVDVEQVGIIRAEAYETGNTNKPIKEFLVSSLRKVSGQREVESMKMRNLRSGQETELKFDPPKN
ncbi:MAG: Outer rane lipoproteinsorting protein, partial [Verrucomicrobiota bacterium]